MPLELKKGVEIDERYVVHEMIGSGGFGAVWKASDKQLSRDVALKRLLKVTASTPVEDAKKVLEEARKHAKLVHTNIVQVYDVLEIQGESLIVMEFVDGASLQVQLRELARKGDLLPLDRAIAILRDTLAGIAFAHERQIVHRDLSPANILLTKSGIPKIADFGIARVLSQQGVTPGTGHTQGGTGNPNFMAPEQARGEAADFGSDLFMLGIVGYLLLSGRHPFAHGSGLFSIPELLQDALFNPEAPVAPSVLGTSQQRLFREYAAVVMRLMHREKAGRFATARDAIEVLENIEPTLDCPQCGDRMPETFKFCGACGTALTKPQAVRPSGAHAPPVPARDEDADELVDRGFRASQLRRWNDAIALYQAALRIDPAHAKACRNMAYALNRIGRYEEAEEAASTGLGIGGQASYQRASLLNERSFARANLKKYEEALSDINELLTLQPDSIRGLHGRARVHLFMGRADEARADALEVLKREPDHNGAIRLLSQLPPAA